MTRSLAGRDSPTLTVKRRTKANAKYRTFYFYFSTTAIKKEKRKLILVKRKYQTF